VSFSKKFWKRALLLTTLVIVVLLLWMGYIQRQKFIYPLRYTEYVEWCAEEYDLEPALIYAVIRSESSFNEDAKSPSGALGLMQIMPDTFEWLQEGEGENYSSEDLFQPEINIRYGCRYLSMMFRKYGILRTALCAYNAGPGTVDGWLGDSGLSPDGKNLMQIPYPETRNYVNAVERDYKKYKELYKI
jgi:soluble lytic murein transglycosylase